MRKLKKKKKKKRKVSEELMLKKILKMEKICQSAPLMASWSYTANFPPCQFGPCKVTKVEKKKLGLSSNAEMEKVSEEWLLMASWSYTANFPSCQYGPCKVTKVEKKKHLSSSAEMKKRIRAFEMNSMQWILLVHYTSHTFKKADKGTDVKLHAGDHVQYVNHSEW